jgi:hypothetical protein
MPRIAAKESDVDDLKELLPLAARACGYTFDPIAIGPDGARLIRGNIWWNPLTPGDGAKMEDKLRIGISWLHDCVVCFAQGKERAERYADHHDEGTARQWASLRVAAEIGRSLK